MEGFLYGLLKKAAFLLAPVRGCHNAFACVTPFNLRDKAFMPFP
jgi:hypothetical protein